MATTTLKKSSTIINPAKIVLPAPNPITLPKPININPIRFPIQFKYAPAWFYSALNWLGYYYSDGGHFAQSFKSYLAGSDVDPYSELGSTRLFVIWRIEQTYYLTIANDTTSLASSTGGTAYANTDAGILSMYSALAASSIFSVVKYCYIPGQVSHSLSGSSDVTDIPMGYDTATGLRSIVLGSAASQVVPLNDFVSTYNEQIYNTSPQIVPFVVALVYDITTNNTLNAKTFVLPAYYVPDQTSVGQYYVNKYAAIDSKSGVSYGQTVLFPGGPGYNDSAATPLTLSGATTTIVSDQLVTTYNFDKATVVTQAPKLAAKAQIGVYSLTYTGVPSTVFGQQNIIGFYQSTSSAWTKTFGIPIYDYGYLNASFSLATQSSALTDPVVIYDPTHPTLNGGSLQQVVRNLMRASYLFSPDKLVEILNSAATSAKDSREAAGLAVTSANLDFTLDSPPSAPILDHLSVPVSVTVTTVPPPIQIPINRLNLEEKATIAPITPITPILNPILLGNTSSGGAANTPNATQYLPSTTQIGLKASIPNEALAGTGISNIEIGTNFPQQALGAGATFETIGSAGVMINIMARPGDFVSFPPYSLNTANAGVTFKAGITYVLSLTGANLTVRGSDNTSTTSVIDTPPPAGHTYVGSMIYTASTTRVILYAKLPLTLPPPAVGMQGVLQGSKYSVRLTIGDGPSSLDIIDSTGVPVTTNIRVPTPTATDGSDPRIQDLYFGSFVGGASQMTVWSVPIFLVVGPAQFPAGASYFGTMTLVSEASGLPSYQLHLTDSSLFVYTNINVDTGAIGSLSSNNVYLSSAVINSSPDDLTSAAFAPCKLLMGLIRQARMGSVLKYVFVPEDDSVIIGGIRYILSVINLGDQAFDPNSLPYPPVLWPANQYWQFANRHNPYLDVSYTGETQTDRISQAQADTARIGLATETAQEPMHMYLDTITNNMVVWPIYPFPYATASQSVDQASLLSISSTILDILATQFPTPTKFVPGSLDGEKINIPPELSLNNPYTSDVATTASPNTAVNTTSTNRQVTDTTILGKQVTNLSPNTINQNIIPNFQVAQSIVAQQAQTSAAAISAAKLTTPLLNITQSLTASPGVLSRYVFRRPPALYGFSVYNPGTGEAYLIEVVESDDTPPDTLPNATQNKTYDPYYVRVVFLNTLTCYNMSIIAPSMVYDQFNVFAKQGVSYENLLSNTDELTLGYMASLYNQSNNFNNISLYEYPPPLFGLIPGLSQSQTNIFTNKPYSTSQFVLFNPTSLFGNIFSFNAGITSTTATTTKALAKDAIFTPVFDPGLINWIKPTTAPAYFVCRRQNWKADCHLMQATHAPTTAAYLAFGGGDIVPLKLNNGVIVDKRRPDHMFQLTQTLADVLYEAARIITVQNTPYVITNSVNGNYPMFRNFSINPTAGTSDITMTPNYPLQFPVDTYVVGQASTTLTAVDTTLFMNPNDSQGNPVPPQFQVLTYNNLVYLIRAVSNVTQLGQVGGLGVLSGLLIDTFVPSMSGNLNLAQEARHKRSGMQYFGASYTPTTFEASLDNLDYTSIIGETFYTSTIFIPIPEIDGTKGFIADLSNFLGQQVWTFIYPEVVVQPSETYPNGLNIDSDGKPILTLQKLHFVYDPIATLFTPNDLAHKYPLQPKQPVLSLTNGQIREGICWRSANLQSDDRNPPTNICAQQILPAGQGMDRPNIIYSSTNRPVQVLGNSNYLGMSVNSFISISGTTYSVEEPIMQGALAKDAAGSKFISAVSSTTNMLIGVLFDYDNNDLGTLTDQTQSTKGMVYLNGYLSASGYTFSSPDHFDVNDVLRSQEPLLEQIATTMGNEEAYFNTDASLPRQFWTLPYDTVTAMGLGNYISNAPPSPVDPSFSNRTRSLILSMENSVFPTELGLMDTYNSVVSANLHLQNGVTGSVFLNKKADRDVVALGNNPNITGGAPLFGLPANWDLYIFSRDHYSTLDGAWFEIIDEGYAMCLVDDGSGTGSKVARYYVDSDGNYFELFTYALLSTTGEVIEKNTFTLKVALGAPENLAANPIVPETPNNVNPQDLVAEINNASALIYAAFGASSPGQAPTVIPIQGSGGTPQAGSIMGAPGFNGYSLNVMGANRQPVQITNIYSGAVTYPIAGSTTISPVYPKSGNTIPFYGSLSHGLDRQWAWPQLQSASDPTVFLSNGTYGGTGAGALVGTNLSAAFQGTAAIPAAASGATAAGSIMPGDDSVFYSFNGLKSKLMDSNGNKGKVRGGFYFVDDSDTTNPPIYVVAMMPYFWLNNIKYTINLGTTLADGVTPRYSLVVGGQSHHFDAGNATVTVDRTKFTFNEAVGNTFSVSYGIIDSPSTTSTPSSVTLMPLTFTGGGVTTTIDAFNDPGSLGSIRLGIIGRLYSYDPIHAVISITQGANTVTTTFNTGRVFASNSGYGYVISASNSTFTANGSNMFPYNPWISGPPASYSLMTAPKIFTVGQNFYVLDQDSAGNYVTVTGNGSTYPVNPYQFSINGVVYIIDTHSNPNLVVGAGNTYKMTSNNSQFSLDGVQYTIALRENSLNGAMISGQFNITQGNVIVIENYVYQLDTLNGQIVGNGSTYSLTTQGLTYTITTTDRSFMVTTQPNATTVTINNVVYEIGNSTVVGDEITYPILPYRTFFDTTNHFTIELDGTVSVAPPLALSGVAPFTKSTFTDSGVTYTVNDIAAFDGTNYYLISGTLPQFSVASLTYSLRNDGVAISAGPNKTYIVSTTGSLNPNQFTFGSKTIFYGRAQDIAVFDGQNYYALSNNQFTDSTTNTTYTISGNTAVNAGNSYEIYSNLGQGAYFQVPSGSTYYVNIPVADTGSPSGDIYNVFPITQGQLVIPLVYTIKATGTAVTISSTTYTTTNASTITANAGTLTGGFFVDPVTKITYTCVVDGNKITFVDSSNKVYPYPAANTPNGFIAEVVISTGISMAVDSSATPNTYPIINNQFVTSSATYVINEPVAYSNASVGPYYPMVNGRFIVPPVSSISSITYTIRGGTVVKGYLISGDDEFSVDANVVYTINAVNVVKATNQATLSGSQPNQTLTAGSSTYTLNTTTSLATTQPPGLTYNATTKSFVVPYPGIPVTYTVLGSTVQDSRNPPSLPFTLTLSGTQASFTDSTNGVTFGWTTSGNNPIEVSYPYTNNFFIDSISGVTYYIDVTDVKVEAISYLPEITQYAFKPADGHTYLIHYSNVGVIFPVISGANVNAGVATVGSNQMFVHVDQVSDSDTGAGISTNTNSFEVNGNLYTIAGHASGTDYSACQVVGDGIAPITFSSTNTFSLTDPSVVYTLQLDASNLPISIMASYAVRPSQDLVTVNDNVYVITYTGVSTGSLLGQGQASIAINNSSFTLKNNFDSTTAKFIFADLNIYDAASVVGQFNVYFSPTFVIGSSTYTLDPTRLIVSDDNKRPFPLITNPTMFSINGSNYLIDTNRVPHAVVGNNNVSPLATDVTVQSGNPIPNSTFTLNGLVFKYTEDSFHNLLTITETQTYTISQPAQTFKLDSSLVFTLSTAAPGAGTYPGPTAPIGTVSAGTLVLNIYAGVMESGNLDYFTYKNSMYVLTKSKGVYTAIQKTYTVYASSPTANQQQLAIFDMTGSTYIVSDVDINPSTIWASTASLATETQFGIVYGFASQPTTVTKTTESGTTVYQFMVTDSNSNNTLYDILYVKHGSTNVVKVDPSGALPQFLQKWKFGTFTKSSPLVFETGGYNAFTSTVSETAEPLQSFSASYRTPVTSTDPQVDGLVTAQGDFTLEFWHSTPIITPPPAPYHAVTYNASTSAPPLVYFLDVVFEDSINTVYLKINGTAMVCVTAPTVFSTQWRHLALTYSQPYTILCQGAGYEVKTNASNLDVSTDFSIVMTFSAQDVNTNQGLLYKGTYGAPALSMSYRVAINGGTVTLTFTDANGTPTNEFQGPQGVLTAQGSQASVFRVTLVKSNDTILSSGGSTAADPYAPPFNTSDLGSAQNGISGNMTNGPNGAITVNAIKTVGESDKVTTLLNNLASPPPQTYSISISIQTIGEDGSASTPVTNLTPNVPANSGAPGLLVNATGGASLLIGTAFDNNGQEFPLGSATNAGNISNVFVFNAAISPLGITSAPTSLSGAPTTNSAVTDATLNDLLRSGLIGCWRAAYDPNGIVNNLVDSTAVALSRNSAIAKLAPQPGAEFQGTSLYINGFLMPISFLDPSTTTIPPEIDSWTTGSSQLSFNNGTPGNYLLSEISVWNQCRQQYQIVDDMFGRLLVENEPTLALYLSGSWTAPQQSAPLLPMNSFIDNIQVNNPLPLTQFSFQPASLSLQGCPAVGRCGPLITPNLYTPPGPALTVADTVPYLTTYSVTLNGTTTSLAGEINEAYVYIADHVLTLYAGKKVGDLVLSWVSQEQGDVQIIGYIEGAPPAPMANLTLKPSYAGATSLTFSAPTSVFLSYQQNSDELDDETTKLEQKPLDFDFKEKINFSPFGVGIHMKAIDIGFSFGLAWIWEAINDKSTTITSTNKLDESNKYTIKLEGNLMPRTGDLFMSNLNALTTNSNTPGGSASKTAILPNPTLGGFTTSNPAGALPTILPTEEKFGQPMFQPSSYGQAFVTSETLDVYQQTLLQSKTTYGFVRIPNSQIPRDFNIVSFRMSSKYIRPGVLDGVVGYQYLPATLPSGAESYTISTGQMEPVYDKNFSTGEVGHSASYMKVVEAYQLTKQIDQEALNAMAKYNSMYAAQSSPSDPSFTPGLDFYNEYIWTSRGGSQEIKHNFTTTYDENYLTSSTHSVGNEASFNLKLNILSNTILNSDVDHTYIPKHTLKSVYESTGTSTFDITASFDGIENDTQMRYASNNDAHFAMINNSMFNPANQSGLNLVISSDGLMFNIAPNVSSGAGLPTSDNIDDSATYSQPQPAYTTGNADGLTGTLEPYDRPGKTKSFRSYAYFLQPSSNNSDDFWNTVIDPVWLANSTDSDASAMRDAQKNTSIPWRILYRVTDSERFLPPLSNASVAVPQITPVMAVPVTDSASDFLFGSKSTKNPANDIEANIVLCVPSATGLSVGSTPTSGTNAGSDILPNNTIPFNIAKNVSTLVNWGDTTATTILTSFLKSAQGTCILPLTSRVPPGSTKILDVGDPVNGGTLYSSYYTPDGLTIYSSPTNAYVTIYIDPNNNPIQYQSASGSFHSLQADYTSSPDGSVMYYIEPPSGYDPSAVNLVGDYDLSGSPGDEWRYYLVSGFGSDMTSEPSVQGYGPFRSSSGASPYTGFSVAPTAHSISSSTSSSGVTTTTEGALQVSGYVLVKSVVQYPHLNTNAEVFADVGIYKTMSLWDFFPVGDLGVLMGWLKGQYPQAEFWGAGSSDGGAEIGGVMARNIATYFGGVQTGFGT